MRFFYAFVAFLVSCASVFAQANLTGTITDASGQPLPGVTVSVLENGQIKSGDGWRWKLQNFRREGRDYRILLLGIHKSI